MEKTKSIVIRLTLNADECNIESECSPDTKDVQDATVLALRVGLCTAMIKQKELGEKNEENKVNGRVIETDFETKVYLLLKKIQEDLLKN